MRCVSAVVVSIWGPQYIPAPSGVWPSSMHEMTVKKSGATRTAMQGTFCKLCDCWVPGEQGDGIWQQHIHSQRHRRSQSTSNYRSAPATLMPLPMASHSMRGQRATRQQPRVFHSSLHLLVQQIVRM